MKAYDDELTKVIHFEGHTHYPQQINVWRGILGSGVSELLFINGNLNSDIYFDMLGRTINPLIIGIQIEEDPNPILDEAEIYLQQDAAPPPYVLPVHQWFTIVHDAFPDKWIGRREPTEWPAMYPDLRPLDFLLLCLLPNQKVCMTSITTSLKAAMISSRLFLQGSVRNLNIACIIV